MIPQRLYTIDWKSKSKGFDVEVEMNHYVERRGYSILELPIYYKARLGEKKLKLRHELHHFEENSG